MKKFCLFGQDALDQLLFLHALQAVFNLKLVWPEQRTPSVERDANLNTRKTPMPTEDDPPDCAGHAAVLEHKSGNGCATIPFTLIKHVMEKSIMQRL